MRKGKGATFHDQRTESRRAPVATMRDVANAARVSIMTVSNVVNGRFDLMTDQTRQRVDEAIERLNYRRHASGRSLRLAQRFSIGMLVVDRSPTFLTDPFITYLVAGLSNGLGQEDYSLLVRGLAASEIKSASLIRNHETDAICVLMSGPPGERRSCLQQLAECGQPILLFQERSSVDYEDICVVRQDDFGGAVALTQNLVERGAERLMMLAPEIDWPAIEERRRGIEHTAANTTLSVSTCGDGGFDLVRQVLHAMNKEQLPDAILAGNDQIGIAAIAALAALGIHVPDQVIVTGFNAFEFHYYSTAKLTTVRSPAYELGEAGAREVLHRLTTRQWARKEVVLPVALVPSVTG